MIDVGPSPGPLARYRQGIAEGRWQDDPAQRAALEELERIQRALVAHAAWSAEAWWRRAFRPVPPWPRGLYLWGGVGRGKTFLMDLFFESLPGDKQRLHFHRFMAGVHAALREIEEVEDPLALVARRMLRAGRVLCFDEFFVTDIGDAMLLGRLLEHLFERGAVLVATSNCRPDRLYHDGLQRARFLPAIAALERHCVVHELGGTTDYRLRTLTRSPIYFTPADAKAEQRMAELFERLAPGAVEREVSWWVNERPITLRRRADGLAWAEFTALCVGPRAAADYIELCQSFNTVFVAGVPVLDDGQSDPARRFIHLVDEAYDRRVKLIVSAAAPVTELYRGERLAFEFQRTQSRLIEMQSTAYLGAAHRP